MHSLMHLHFITVGRFMDGYSRMRPTQDYPGARHDKPPLVQSHAVSDRSTCLTNGPPQSQSRHYRRP